MSSIEAINRATARATHAAPASTLIGQKPSPWFNVLATIVVVAGIIYTGIHLANDLSIVRDTRAYPYILLGIALFIALGFEFVNGFHDSERGGHGNLHPLDVAESCRRLVRLVQFCGGAGFFRGGRLRHRFFIAGGVDPPGGERRRFCDGVRVLDRSHPVEPEHMVFWLAVLEFAYFDRLHHRAWGSSC
jgi:hypothetical protein